LSGAGISTESGIPDYRGPTGVARNATPMTYGEFVGSDDAQRRYWARSHIGWRRIAAAAPNQGHQAVADLQRSGAVSGIVTQNVDGLHQAAGAHYVIDLHGRLDRVTCLDCHASSSRAVLDARLGGLNPNWDAAAVELKPDGDAVISDKALAAFVYARCEGCGGRLKPDVVFFGENVPKPRVLQAFDLVESARSLVVLGSTLTVASGFRFVRHAAKLGRRIAIVNQGATRADGLADIVVDAPLGITLAAIADDLRSSRSVGVAR
jgi:NAD-dependent SIR2 family protein deacetylase